MLPVPTSGSKDCAKAGSPMTLANVARIRIFFIAVSILEVLEPAFASFSPSIACCEFVVFDDRPGTNTMDGQSFRNIHLIAEHAGTESFLCYDAQLWPRGRQCDGVSS